jgi:hypothetical protein
MKNGNPSCQGLGPLGKSMAIFRPTHLEVRVSPRLCEILGLNVETHQHMVYYGLLCVVSVSVFSQAS